LKNACLQHTSIQPIEIARRRNESVTISYREDAICSLR
jgi:hypothetical protein